MPGGKPQVARVFYCDVGTPSPATGFPSTLKDHKVIGEGHAGVEDTSAILYVKPEWVRKDKIAAKDPAKGVGATRETAGRSRASCSRI